MRALGRLRFDVLPSRLDNEYGVKAQFDKLHCRLARWVAGSEVDIRKVGSTRVRTDLRRAPAPAHPLEAGVDHAPVRERNPGRTFHDVAP